MSPIANCWSHQMQLEPGQVWHQSLLDVDKNFHLTGMGLRSGGPLAHLRRKQGQI